MTNPTELDLKQQELQLRRDQLEFERTKLSIEFAKFGFSGTADGRCSEWQLSSC
jgi:hypothetical protein